MLKLPQSLLFACGLKSNLRAVHLPGATCRQGAYARLRGAGRLVASDGEGPRCARPAAGRAECAALADAGAGCSSLPQVVPAQPGALHLACPCPALAGTLHFLMAFSACKEVTFVLPVMHLVGLYRGSVVVCLRVAPWHKLHRMWSCSPW